MDKKNIVSGVRGFNRYYTNKTGLLNNRIYDMPYSLSEARVIYEVYEQDKCTLKSLNSALGLDYGYLSRMIKKFVNNGLCIKEVDSKDKRINYIELTEQGLGVYNELARKSNENVEEMINQLTGGEKSDLLGHMNAIIGLLEDKKNPVVHIRHELKAGDIGSLIKMHGEHYYDSCGYDHTFEAYVCHTFEEFLESYSEDKDRIWFAEVDGKIIGSIAIVSRSENRGQLRWFLISPQYRGLGLGNKLLKTALDYAKRKGFDSLFLETTMDQQQAIGMYVKNGFKCIRQNKCQLWGNDIVEETYELKPY